MDQGRSVTIAKFRQLHAKLPTETFREPAAGGYWAGKAKSSDVWLDNHPRGFLLVNDLHPYTLPNSKRKRRNQQQQQEEEKQRQHPGKCILIESIDTGERIVNKRLKRYAPDWEEYWEFRETRGKAPDTVPHTIAYQTPVPPELRFARLSDPRVQVRLPDEPYFPELYAYGLLGDEGGFDSAGQPSAFSLYFKQFNGGTLGSLMHVFANPEMGAHIPEPFIWHIMDQLSRAVIWLQTGLTRRDLDAGMTDAEPGWVPIVHRSLDEEDVFLHFPEAHEHPDNLDCCFPRIILGQFDRANMLDDPPHFWSKAKKAARPRPPAAWEDIYLLGKLLRRLVTVHDCGGENGGNIDYDVEVVGNLSRYLSQNLNLPEGTVPSYSDQLLHLLLRFEIDLLRDNPELSWTDEAVRSAIPDVDFLLRVVLPTAEGKVEEFRAMGLDQLISEEPDGCFADVSWARNDPDFETTPYSSGHATERHALEDLKSRLRWLFGPFIPVWYTYEGVDVSKVPDGVREVYQIPVESVEPQTEHALDYDEQQRLDWIREYQDQLRLEERTEEEPDKQDKIEQIRKHQDERRAKELPVRVWFPEDPKDKPPTHELSERSLKIKHDAAIEYNGRINVLAHIDPVEVDYGLADTDLNYDYYGDELCRCSNCTRYHQMLQAQMRCRVDRANKPRHDEVIAEMAAQPKFYGKEHLLPDFVSSSELEIRLFNPFDVGAGVERWIHNPFSSNYKEDWEPDQYYPWKKWDYQAKEPPKLASAAEADQGIEPQGEPEPQPEREPRPEPEPQPEPKQEPQPPTLRRSARIAARQTAPGPAPAAVGKRGKAKVPAKPPSPVPEEAEAEPSAAAATSSATRNRTAQKAVKQTARKSRKKVKAAQELPDVRPPALLNYTEAATQTSPSLARRASLPRPSSRDKPAADFPQRDGGVGDARASAVEEVQMVDVVDPEVEWQRRRDELRREQREETMKLIQWMLNEDLEEERKFRFAGDESSDDEGGEPMGLLEEEEEEDEEDAGEGDGASWDDGLGGQQGNWPVCDRPVDSNMG